MWRSGYLPFIYKWASHPMSGRFGRDLLQARGEL